MKWLKRCVQLVSSRICAWMPFCWYHPRVLSSMLFPYTMILASTPNSTDLHSSKIPDAVKLKHDLDVTIGGTLISPAHVVIAWPHMVLVGLGEIIQARHPIGQLAQPFSHAAQAKRGEGKGREEPGVNYIFMEELLPSFFTPGFVRADYLGGWRIMKNPIYFVVLTHLSCISGELRISYKWILQTIWCLTL